MSVGDPNGNQHAQIFANILQQLMSAHAPMGGAQPAHGLSMANYQQPMFAGESNQGLQRNLQYAKQGPWITQLTPDEEKFYKAWFKKSLPKDFNPDDLGYDMRGYWKDVISKGKMEGDINSEDNQFHFPDTYKTPYNTGFSAESKYAKQNPSMWYGNSLIDLGTGQLMRK